MRSAVGRFNTAGTFVDACSHPDRRAAAAVEAKVPTVHALSQTLSNDLTPSRARRCFGTFVPVRGLPDRRESRWEGSTMTSARGESRSRLLEAITNLAAFHREHEKFYAAAPREQAVVLQRHARTLQALADRWCTAEPSARRPFSPYEGAEDLNDPAALQLDGVLFIEGEGEPAEVTRLKRDRPPRARVRRRACRECGSGIARDGRPATSSATSRRPM